jgi:hypothetical protein
MGKVTGRLENWEVWPLSGGSLMLWGHIHEDERKRFPDGKQIHTSFVTDFDETTRVVTTRNSTYLLGKVREDLVESEEFARLKLAKPLTTPGGEA